MDSEQTFSFQSFVDPEFLKGFALLLIGFFLIYGLARVVRKITSRRISAHFGLLLHNIILYLGTTLLLITGLIEMGLNLSALLGTAGIATIAVGFAAQTSLSNLISGFFLLGEKPFQIGDYIEINKIAGTVISIDLMSVKLRTIDNLYVRIPNEAIIKSDLTNKTRFPIRRLDLLIPVPKEIPVSRIEQVLMSIAEASDGCLDEPEPRILFEKIEDSYLIFKFCTWTQTEGYIQYSSDMMGLVKTRFDQEGICFPYPMWQIQQLDSSESHT